MTSFDNNQSLRLLPIKEIDRKRQWSSAMAYQESQQQQFRRLIRKANQQESQLRKLAQSDPSDEDLFR